MGNGAMQKRWPLRGRAPRDFDDRPEVASRILEGSTGRSEPIARVKSPWQERLAQCDEQAGEAAPQRIR